MVVETPRGVHLYFRHPGTHVGNRTRVKDETAKPRYDIRGDGGYVVAPPSEVVADGEDVKVFTLPPASGAKVTEWLVGDCTGHELLAVTEDGQEVERREPGLCLDDVWLAIDMR